MGNAQDLQAERSTIPGRGPRRSLSFPLPQVDSPHRFHFQFAVCSRASGLLVVSSRVFHNLSIGLLLVIDIGFCRWLGEGVELCWRVPGNSRYVQPEAVRIDVAFPR